MFTFSKHLSLGTNPFCLSLVAFSFLSLLSHILPYILISRLPIGIGVQLPTCSLSFTDFGNKVVLHLTASSGIPELHQNIADISSVVISLMSLSQHLSGPEAVSCFTPFSASFTSLLVILP